MNIEQIITWRNHLHQYPELALDTVETSRYIRSQLAYLDCQFLEPIPNSLCLYFDFGKEHTLAIRSDMDALPVKENTNVPYKSRNEGCMHACGHDGHMAMLMGAAAEIDEKRKKGTFVPLRNILLIFQPGEENPGGAGLIMETCLFDKYHVDQVFGMHLWPGLPKGVIAARAGAMMAQSSEVTIRIHGKAAHVAKYHEGIDAAQTAANLLLNIYEKESQLDETIPRLLRFGHMQAGTIRNVVAQDAVLEGTLRAFDPVVFAGLKSMVDSEAAKAEKETGAKITIHYSDGYPAVINDEGLTNAVLSRFDVQRLEAPEMISEDFSFYGQKCPSVFFFLGTGTGIPLHDSRFDFDGDLLGTGSAFWVQLAQTDLQALSSRPA